MNGTPGMTSGDQLDPL